MTFDSESDVVLEFATEGASALESGEYGEMGWKGFVGPRDLPEGGSDEVGSELPAAVGNAKPKSEDGLDMTPMVDVTFLLLIFFMVTASFTLQKSIAQPPYENDGPSGVPVVQEELVTVTIDGSNTFYVTSCLGGEVECPSEREMWTRVKEAQKISEIDRMAILAHVDSMHKKVISAWDAGVVAGIEKISIETTEEEL